MKFLDKHFSTILVVVLMWIVFTQRIADRPAASQAPIIIVTSDTTNREHTGSVNSQPIVYQTIPIPYSQIPAGYVPSSNVDSVRAQYQRLLAEHFAKNIQKDSLGLDTLGYVKTTDTVQGNKIVGRGWDYKVNERTITTTITIKEPYKPKRQLYAGGGVGFNLNQKVSDVTLGALYKNKKDQIFGLHLDYNLNVPAIKDGTSIQFSSYWRLRFK